MVKSRWLPIQSVNRVLPLTLTKQRITALTTPVVPLLRSWLSEPHSQGRESVFTTHSGGMLSRDPLEHRLADCVAKASNECLSLQGKRITLHVLRHTAAMRLLRAGIDLSIIALWHGHEQMETTQIYLHADLAMKERALARTTPVNTSPGRYRPPDTLFAFLETL